MWLTGNMTSYVVHNYSDDVMHASFSSSSSYVRHFKFADLVHPDFPSNLAPPPTQNPTPVEPLMPQIVLVLSSQI